MKTLQTAIVILFLLFSPVSFSSAGEQGPALRTAQVERLPKGEREKVLKNYENYKQLPPEEKNRLREQYRQYQQAPPGEKERLKENYGRYEKMPPEVKDNLEQYLRKKTKTKR